MKDRIEIVIETDHESDKQLKAYEFALMFAMETILQDPENKLERDSKEIEAKANQMVEVPKYRSHIYEVDYATVKYKGYRIEFQSMAFKTKIDVKTFPGMFEKFKEKQLPVNELYVWKDSCCRDVTVNALHYNISNGFVEDYLGNGIQDLKDGVLRTADGVYAQNTLQAQPQRILSIVRFAERLNFRIDEGILNYVMDNEVFRHSYELVNIDKIKSEMEKMLELDPYQHIRAWHLLHLMGLMSASMRFENVKAGWNLGYINSAIDSGLTCAYILNHLAAEDMDKSEYFHKNRLNIMYACFFSNFFKTHIDDAMKAIQFRVDTKKFIYDTKEKVDIIRTIANSKME